MNINKPNMRTCPSCGGIVGRDCFNPIECAQITESLNRQHDQDHYKQGYDLGYHEGYQAAKNEPPEPSPQEPLTGKELFDAWEDIVRRIWNWKDKGGSWSDLVSEIDKEWKISKGAGVRQDGIVPCDTSLI